MNRKDRRSIGFTESRYRKFDLSVPAEWNPFHSYSRPEAYKLGSSVAPRRDRLDGKPRRWQTERARRVMQQIDEIVLDES